MLTIIIKLYSSTQRDRKRRAVSFTINQILEPETDNEVVKLKFKKYSKVLSLGFLFTMK